MDSVLAGSALEGRLADGDRALLLPCLPFLLLWRLLRCSRVPDFRPRVPGGDPCFGDSAHSKFYRHKRDGQRLLKARTPAAQSQQQGYRKQNHSGEHGGTYPAA